MDRSSGKRGAGGSVTPRKNYSATAFREATTQGDESAQFCNRIGCSGRIKFGQNARIGISDTSKYSKPSFHCSSGNEATGKISRSNSTVTNAKRSCVDSKRKVTSQVTSDPSETESSLSTEPEAQGIVSTPSNLRGYQPEPMTKSKEVNMTEAGSSSASTSVGPRKPFRCKSELRNQSTSPASPVPSASRSSALRPFNRINGSRYGLRNLRCNSISDAVPPSCSQPESAYVRKNVINKRSSEGESSSPCRGRRNTASPNVEHTSPTTSGISFSDLAYSTSASVEDSSGSSSTWSRRSMNVNARMRFSSRQDGRNGSSVREPAVSFSRNDHETPFDVDDGSNLQQFSVSGSRSHHLSGINSDNSSSRTSFASAESGLTHLMNHDVLRGFNMDGIAEVLMALERIGQDEELTHEQILALETRLFLSGLNLYDQHRDMRLDIDNMTYEELLALEERMGTVSTALSEEALSKCLTRRVYEATPSRVETSESGEDGDDIKCSICQEEYASGDEIGSLVKCQHGYHAVCINQWLQVKNWCPICKASAAPSQSSSSL
ncbi:probable E3 ubiquitin-protein ligase RHG1A [Salvia miltiorrhiza]|uniref:probable E3 ubiquitin-protein ligase RHG1A n=1 Tax=Salvia miltiorrhiza TaxID=226208 RepID=UPI0025ABF85B|nr:probable E3 ubiquitin-protein ligase RHG1A [Salvia miltiorrhiza]XP_057799244.1 probable E3 ubiquitin-protein ligase RHG1A [Salvia miltiorrhiza]